MRSRHVVCLAVIASLGLPAVLPGRAQGDTATPAAVKEAGERFGRGVLLYSEADYGGALVEFRRAYEIAPNAAVLYNIGQTYYQLQNYAAALGTFERYLSEAGAAATHRDDVEQTIGTLRARVGKLTITNGQAGCEIAIDDEPVGKTPLGAPVLVSIGRRRVTAACKGHPLQTRFAELAAGDNLEVAFTFGPRAESAQPAQPGPGVARASRSRLLTAGWIATAALGTAAITTGVFAFQASRDLEDARGTPPATRDDLDRKASRVTALAITADVLTVATLITGGVALAYTLSRSSSHDVQLTVVPGGLQLAGAFP